MGEFRNRFFVFFVFEFGDAFEHFAFPWELGIEFETVEIAIQFEFSRHGLECRQLVVFDDVDRNLVVFV